LDAARSGGEMQARRVMLADGRYLIFYTFGDAEGGPGAGESVARPEPAPEPSAEEERSV
jgi:hypothetical protein